MSSYFCFEAKNSTGARFTVASYSRSNMMYRVWEEVGVPSYAEARVITPEVINEAINEARVMKQAREENIAHINDSISDIKDIARGARPDAIEDLWGRILDYKDEIKEAEGEVHQIDGIIYELYTWRDMVEYENEGWTFYGHIEGWLPGEKPED